MFNPDMDVLVVDDAATMRRIIKGLLHELGFKNMREAVDGSTALEELKRKKADLVVSDWNMPVMTGIDLLKAVRADADLKAVPVLKALAFHMSLRMGIVIVAIRIRVIRACNRVPAARLAETRAAPLRAGSAPLGRFSARSGTVHP